MCGDECSMWRCVVMSVALEVHGDELVWEECNTWRCVVIGDCVKSVEYDSYG